MKNKKILNLISMVVLVLVILIAAIPLIGIFSAEPIKNRVFTDIADFGNLDEYAIDTDLSDDKLPEDLVSEVSFLKEITYGGNNYKIYAYIFSDSNSAQEYFNEYTGKESVADYNYSMSTNYFFSSHYIAHYECYLYRIEGGNYKDFAEVVNFINESFAIDINDLIKNDRS